MVISNVLSPDYTNSWLASTPHITSFPLSHIPHTLELTTTLFHIYQSRGGVSLPHLQVKTILNTTAANISNAVMYMESMNGTTSSIVLPADFERNSNTSRQFDIVVGSYPTLYPLLSPSPSIFANMSVVSVIISVKVWSPDGITIGNLPSTPIIITLAHARKVYSITSPVFQKIYLHDLRCPHLLVTCTVLHVCVVCVVCVCVYRCMSTVRELPSVSSGRTQDHSMYYTHTHAYC